MFCCSMLNAEVDTRVQFKICCNLHLDGCIHIIRKLMRLDIISVIGFGNTIQTFHDGMTYGKRLQKFWMHRWSVFIFQTVDFHLKS